MAEYLSPTDQLHQWQENGRSSSHVAFYGTSVFVLRDILQTNMIAPYDPDYVQIIYPEAVAQGFPNIYLSYPCEQNLQQIGRTDLLPTIFGADWDENLGNIGPNETYRHKGASRFARYQSLWHFFLHKTGHEVSFETLDTMAEFLNPEVFQVADARMNGLLLPGFSQEELRAELEEVLSTLNLSEAEFVFLLKDALSFYGVTLYFNKHFIDSRQGIQKVIPSTEEDGELIIASQELLPASVIEGVEFNSEADRNLLLSLLQPAYA